LVLTTTSTDARWRPATGRGGAAARVDGDEGASVVGGEKGGAAGLPLTTAHLTAVTASGGDCGDGAATLPKTAGGDGGLGARRGGARRHGRARERGQMEEDDEGKLYMALDRRDRAPNERNRLGKKSNSVLGIRSKRIRFGENTQRFALILGGKERGEREEQNPSNNRKNPGRIWADLAAQNGGSGGLRGGGRRKETTPTGGPHLSAAEERGAGGGG
jgi:Domain of unknown function (DUF834).